VCPVPLIFSVAVEARNKESNSQTLKCGDPGLVDPKLQKISKEIKKSLETDLHKRKK